MSRGAYFHMSTISTPYGGTSQTRRRATMDRPAAPAYLERGRNDGLNPLGAIELPEITDPRLRLLHDLWQTELDPAVRTTWAGFSVGGAAAPSF